MAAAAAAAERVPTHYVLPFMPCHESTKVNLTAYEKPRIRLSHFSLTAASAPFWELLGGEDECLLSFHGLSLLLM